MPVDSQSMKILDAHLIRDQTVNLSSLEKHAVGSERAASHLLRRPHPGTRANSNTDPASYFMEGERINVMGGGQYENSLFSSSLSELFSRKCKFHPSASLISAYTMHICSCVCHLAWVSQNITTSLKQS